MSFVPCFVTRANGDLLQVQHGLRKGETGSVEVVVGGASIPLQDHLANLRNSSDSGYQHHFSASGARGMGVTLNASVAPGMTTLKEFNFTQQMALISNPEQGGLQAEAGRSRHNHYLKSNGKSIRQLQLFTGSSDCCTVRLVAQDPMASPERSLGFLGFNVPQRPDHPPEFAGSVLEEFFIRSQLSSDNQRNTAMDMTAGVLS